MKNNVISKKIIALTKKLIRIQTTPTNFEENNRALHLISSLIGGNIVINPKTKHKSLLWQPKQKHIFWLGHIDVVPGNTHQFFPSIKGNKLIGRGSWDMKGSLATFLTLIKETPQLKEKVGFLITTDEETGGINGANWLINTNKIKFGKIKGIVVGEPTNLKISNKSKGLLVIKIFLQGISAHASQPWLGKNAAEAATVFIQFLKQIFNQPHSLKEWQNSFNVGFLKAGSKQTNIIPNKAEIQLDIRFVNQNETKELIRKIIKFLTKMKKEQQIINFKLQIRLNNPCEYLQKGHPFITNFQQTAKKIGINLSLSESFGASDGRFFIMKDPTIPLIRFGPIGEGAHSSFEWVCTKSLLKQYSILRDFFNKQNHQGDHL